MLHQEQWKLFIRIIVVSGLFSVHGIFGQAKFIRQTLDSDHGIVAVCDLNNDGQNDVVKAASGGESLVLYRYVEPGSLVKHVLLRDVRFRGDRIASGDIDNDGDIDLVAGLNVAPPNEEEQYAIVWLQNPLPEGDPTAESSWTIQTIGSQNEYVKNIALVDMNRDGHLDVVTRAQRETALYLQTNTSTWHKDLVLEHESRAGMGVGDLDNDGGVDIVLNGFWFENPDNPTYQDFQRHVFDEKWFTPVDYSWRDNNAEVKVVDLNQDNLLDILISHSELPGYPISYYTANPVENIRKDHWTEVRITSQFNFCQTLDAGDVDNDGDIDVLAAKFQRNPEEGEQWTNAPPFPVVLYENKDGIGLEWQPTIIAEDGMYAGVLGDVGSDGDLDIVGSGSYWRGPLHFWENTLADNPLSLDAWTYILVDSSRGKWGDFDEPEWLKYFGLDMADVTGDGYQDIVSGRYFYRNPGGDMNRFWPRVDLGLNVDGMLFVDVDGDEYGDIIGTAFPEVFWLEASDREGSSWNAHHIGYLKETDHINGQGYASAQIVRGGKQELLLTAGDGIYYLEIPNRPERDQWPATLIAPSAYAEGIAAGDIDRDGDIDVIGGYVSGGEKLVPGTGDIRWDNTTVAWWENPGDGSAKWTRHDIGEATQADRFELGDINGDGRTDVIISEERYPGTEPNASLHWFEAPENPRDGRWVRHTIFTGYSLNNLDVADLDRDGDPDIITNEHKGPAEKTLIFENNGGGHFIQHILGRGKEAHLGAQAADLDGDGDLDIVSHAWDEHQYLHLWRNDAIPDINSNQP